jgi:hypothetical protein
MHLTSLEKFDAMDHTVNGRRCIRVRDEPEDRSLAEEEKRDEYWRTYHARRAEEEIAEVKAKCEVRCDAIRRRYEARIEKLRHKTDEASQLKAENLADAMDYLIRHCRQRMGWKIEAIPQLRAKLTWSCPNDGRAYEFEWEGQRYLRTYQGEIWRDAAEMVYDRYTYTEAPHAIPVIGEWVGIWAGRYIRRAPEPAL